MENSRLVENTKKSLFGKKPLYVRKTRLNKLQEASSQENSKTLIKTQEDVIENNNITRSNVEKSSLSVNVEKQTRSSSVEKLGRCASGENKSLNRLSFSEKHNKRSSFIEKTNKSNRASGGKSMSPFIKQIFANTLNKKGKLFSIIYAFLLLIYYILF